MTHSQPVRMEPPQMSPCPQKAYIVIEQLFVLMNVQCFNTSCYYHRDWNPLYNPESLNLWLQWKIKHRKLVYYCK